MTTLQEKESQYNELVSRIIINKKIVGENLFDMGLDLKKIKERELYLLEFRSFEEFLEKKVEIHRKTAYRLILIAREYSRIQFRDWGLYKLELIAYIEDKEDRKEFMKRVVTSSSQEQIKHEITEFKLEKGISEITRFKSQAGIQTASNQETELKLIRQYNKIEGFLDSLKESLANWLAEGRKHTNNEEIRGLIVKAEELNKRLK